jgi:hypothetical protein
MSRREMLRIARDEGGYVGYDFGDDFDMAWALKRGLMKITRYRKPGFADLVEITDAGKQWLEENDDTTPK